jgi:hypothetical protein
MIGIIALAAAVTAAPPNCSYSNFHQLGPWDRAQCQFALLSPYPELVRFRNVRTVGADVCGEVNTPGKNNMSGFQAFVWRDDNNWARKLPDGFVAQIDGRTQSSDGFDSRGRNAGSMIRFAEAQRKQKFEVQVREMLGACASQLNAD